MKSSVKYMAGPLVGALMMIGLVGCSSPANTPEPTVSSSATPAPAETDGPSVEPTQEETIEVPTGAVVSPEEAELLPQGQRAYKMPDQSQVVVAATEPLPAPVREVIQAKVQADIPTGGSLENGTIPRSQIISAAAAIAGTDGVFTGKKLVVVFPVNGSCKYETEPYAGWAHTSVTLNDDFDCNVLRTREEAEARAAQLISQQAEPAKYEIFVKQ